MPKGRTPWKNRDHIKNAYKFRAEKVIKPNLRKRAEMASLMSRDPEAVKLFREKARRDIFFFFEYFAWTFDPRPTHLRWYGLTNGHLPFLLYDEQKKVVKAICHAIDNGEDLLVDKSRDQGCTWLVITTILWYWLKGESGNNFLIGSRKFDNVDKKGAEDTLFQKFRYNLYRLPRTFLPEGWDPGKHDNVGFIQNVDTENFVRGEANNENFATSGRYKAIFADEMAKWLESDDAAWTSMGSSTPCRIAVSTPYGMDKKFSRLRFSDAIKVMELHWTKNPLHNYKMEKVAQHPYLPDKKDVWVSPWYLEECKRRSTNPTAEIGQELDMDHLTAGTPYFRSQMAYIQERYRDLANYRVWRRYEVERLAYDQIELVENSAGRICIDAPYVEGWRYRYLISCDVSEGLEHGDRSIVYVFDRVEGVDVAHFYGIIDTHLLILLLIELGKMYGDCYIAVEANNHGHHVNQGLKKMYPYLYHRQEFEKLWDEDLLKVGWHTNVKTRAIMCGRLREALAEQLDGVYDQQFFAEATTFITDPRTGKARAPSGQFDDRIMTQAIKWMIHDWLPAPHKTVVEFDRHKGKPRFGHAPKEEKDIRTFW